MSGFWDVVLLLLSTFVFVACSMPAQSTPMSTGA
jgi:hypothetical protein